MNNKGQLSIIAALLVAVILITTVIVTYSLVRDNPIEGQPSIQSALDETNLGIKQILGFTVGYYGSVLKVTGNSSYAKTLATGYLQSGLVQIANMHPEWASSLNVGNLNLYASWFSNSSYSGGDLSVTYNLTTLGISGMNYTTSCELSVNVANPVNGQACLNVWQDIDQPLVSLGKQNFKFFTYQGSTWNLTSPSTDPTVYGNGTYQIATPAGIDANSYIIQVQDQRGIIAVASTYSSYIMNLTWPSWPSVNLTQQSYVNNGVSDADSNGDLGGRSNFTAEQYGPDSTYDTLTEAPNSAGTSSFGNPSQSGTGYTSVPGDDLYGQSFTSPVNAATMYNVTFYGRFSSGTHNVKAILVLRSNLNIVANGMSNPIPIGATAGWYTATFSTPPNISPNTAYVLMIIPDTTSFRLYYTSTSGGNEYYDTTNSYSSPTNPTDAATGTHQYSIYCNCSLVNYKLDMEAQWTGLNLSQNASLCIYGGNMSTENLLVDAWTGSTWQSIIANLTSGWNNYTVSSYVNPPNFTIRFRDGNSGDPTQTSWQIDAALLRFDLKEGSLSAVPDTVTMELLQNGTIRWLGQNLTRQANPFPPLPTKAIHVNQTINGADSEVSFQIEDWASGYTVPLGLTSNASVFSDGNMLVFLANSKVSRIKIWWNGTDTATQTPYAYTNRYFNDSVTTTTLTLRNNMLTLNLTNPSTFTFTSSNGSSSCTIDFMRINQQLSTYGSDQPVYVITNGTVRDIIRQEPEWSGGVTGAQDLYGLVVLTLPANSNYFTYQLSLMFQNTLQTRNITEICPISLTGLTGQPQAENGVAYSYPTVSNTTGLFYNSSSIWQHHWSQFVQGTKGTGILFTDDSNQRLYTFDVIAKNNSGALRINSTAIELLPATMAPVSFNTSMNIAWYGAIATFSGTTPIYNNTDQTGLWMLAEDAPAIATGTGN